jgi:hypothetical protein
MRNAEQRVAIDTRERSRPEALLRPPRLDDPVSQHSQADAQGLVDIIDRFLMPNESDDTKAGFIKNAVNHGRCFVSLEGPLGHIGQLQHVRQQLEDMAFGRRR